jgi:alkylation response protein AidB-like acyl-CoA dehydrogenase
MAFFQTPPALGHGFDGDRVLRSYLARTLPADVLAAITPELRELGALASGPLYQMQLQDRLTDPVLTNMDPWGKRIDVVELSPLWREAKKLACQHGLVAAAYERKHGPWSRVHQFAMVYLLEPSTDVYNCPLAMTDGAAKSLVVHKNQALIERAVPRLTSRDPATAWTSGQWMTERTGGSDVGISETNARESAEGWRLYGNKYYTSSVISEMALTLARPPGGAPGGKGLALFYVERFDPSGGPNGITVARLKDKLGTRKVPTAELDLDGTLATPVTGLTDGVRNITPMLNITRTWNSICAIASMRRGLELARDYAKKRVQFGAALSDKALHIDTLAGEQAEYEAALLLAFRGTELLGREEAGLITPHESDLLRVLTPIMKLTTGKQAVGCASEVCEAFGGFGYMEDTGIPRIVRDAQVLSIWEGTTNVLSLDTLRALGRTGERLGALEEELRSAVGAATDAGLAAAGRKALDALAHAKTWLFETFPKGPDALEAGARRFALTLGRATALALLVRHAQWSLDHERDGRSRAAALRFVRNGIDRVADGDPLDRAIANDEPLPV